MARSFIQPSQLTRLLREYRPSARLVSLDRLPGGSKKGVYRVTFDDAATVILYAWSAAENYWPASADPADDPFSDATGADLLAASTAALASAGVRIPQVYSWDLSHTAVPADLALVEDVRGGSLEDLIAADPSAAAPPLAQLGLALRAMGGHRTARYGKVALVERGLAAQGSSPEDLILGRAIGHLDAASARVSRLGHARPQVAELLSARRAAVRPRAEYALVHGELGPDHVLIGEDGQPVLIDIEGLTYFDVEWEHAFLRLRFTPDELGLLGLPAPDEARVALYLLAQRISLIEGPLRIADTDFPGREWMLDLAEHHLAAVLAEV